MIKWALRRALDKFERDRNYDATCMTRVNVVRWYRRINGVPMPVTLDTTAQLRLLGSSALRMTYRYAEVDERAVVDEPRE